MESSVLSAETVAAYIVENCTTVSIKTAAEHFCCHPNSLTRLLKRGLGVSFNKLAVDARADLACKLLTDGGMTVQETAAACGYANMTRFYRVFEDRFGCTPGEFRKQALYRETLGDGRQNGQDT